MRKFKYWLATLVVFIASLYLIACGNDVDSLVVKSGLPETIKKGETIVTDEVIASVKFEDGSSIDVSSNDLEFGSIDTSTTGRKSLVIKYKDYETTVYIDVVESEQVSTLSLLESGLAVFNENRLTMLGSDTEESKIYYVGDDNAFNLKIKAAGVNSQGEVVDDLSDYEVDFDVKIKNGDVYQSLDDDALSQYATLGDDHTIDFSESAIGKDFSITVSARNYNTTSQPTFTITNVRVVDAYNVYDAEGLSVLDNTGENGWDTFKSSELKSYSENANGIVLHGDIAITDEDIPELYFYTQEEFENMAGVTAVSNAKNVKIVGSMKDEMSDSWTNIYKRELGANEDFVFYGNYNQIDASRLSKVVIAGDPSTAGTKDVISIPDTAHPESGQAITPHATLIKFDVYDNNLTFPNVDINNVSFVGNGARSSSAYNSGGLILAKIQGVNSKVERTSYYDFLIGYMYECFDSVDSGIDTSKHILKTTKGENCYSSLIYDWAVKDLIIEDSELVSAGGPVMIVDYKVDEDSPDTREWIPSVSIIGSKVESFVTGNEPWFTTYGAGALLSQITPAEAFYNGATYNPSTSQGIPSTGKSFLVDRKQGTSTIEDMLNCICVFKDSSAEGITPNRIKGSVTIYESREGYEEQNRENNSVVHSYGLVSEESVSDENLTDKAMKKNVVYFQSSVTGGYFNTGLVSGDTDTSLYSGTHFVSNEANKEYVNLYLMNGMGLIFELFPVDL